MANGNDPLLIGTNQPIPPGAVALAGQPQPSGNVYIK
jgi:hypothetical protein